MRNQTYRHCTLRVICLSAALLAFAGGMAQAQGDRDAQEVSRYVLSEAGLAKYSAATHNLNKLGKSGQLNCDDETESPSSLDKLVAKANANAGVKAAIQSAGMTAREYVVFSMSLLQTGLAAWGVEQGAKLPPSVSKANLDFYQTHKAAVEKLGGGKKDNCSDSGDDRDSD